MTDAEVTRRDNNFNARLKTDECMHGQFCLSHGLPNQNKRIKEQKKQNRLN